MAAFQKSLVPSFFNIKEYSTTYNAYDKKPNDNTCYRIPSCHFSSPPFDKNLVVIQLMILSKPIIFPSFPMILKNKIDTIIIVRKVNIIRIASMLNLPPFIAFIGTVLLC